MNLIDDPCNDTDAKIDFAWCIKKAVERKINCLIPDIMSGTPVAPEGRNDLPVCSSHEEFVNYTRMYKDMELANEADIFKNMGCLPKCKDCYYENEPFHINESRHTLL